VEETSDGSAGIFEGPDGKKYKFVVSFFTLSIDLQLIKKHHSAKDAEKLGSTASRTGFGPASSVGRGRWDAV